jgi:hypothetical protein
MDKEKIKKALDDFEDDQYVDSKETLRDEIKKKVNDYLKKGLELEDDPLDVSDDNDNDDDESYDEGDEDLKDE